LSHSSFEAEKNKKLQISILLNIPDVNLIGCRKHKERKLNRGQLVKSRNRVDLLRLKT